MGKKNIPLKSSLQRIGKIVVAGSHVFAKLPKAWQQRLDELSLDDNDFIYLDEKLVIPLKLRKTIFRSLHWARYNATTSGRDLVDADAQGYRTARKIMLPLTNASKNSKTYLNQSD